MKYYFIIIFITLFLHNIRKAILLCNVCGASTFETQHLFRESRMKTKMDIENRHRVNMVTVQNNPEKCFRTKYLLNNIFGKMISKKKCPSWKMY